MDLWLGFDGDLIYSRSYSLFFVYSCNIKGQNSGLKKTNLTVFMVVLIILKMMKDSHQKKVKISIYAI